MKNTIPPPNKTCLLPWYKKKHTPTLQEAHKPTQEVEDSPGSAGCPPADAEQVGYGGLEENSKVRHAEKKKKKKTSIRDTTGCVPNLRPPSWITLAVSTRDAALLWAWKQPRPVHAVVRDRTKSVVKQKMPFYQLPFRKFLNRKCKPVNKLKQPSGETTIQKLPQCSFYVYNHLSDCNVVCPNRVAVRPQTHSATPVT